MFSDPSNSLLLPRCPGNSRTPLMVECIDGRPVRRGGKVRYICNQCLGRLAEEAYVKKDLVFYSMLKLPKG